MLLSVLVVGISGFFGSVARYLIYLWASSKNFTSFPLATLLINVSGCLLIGLIGSLVERAVPYHRHLFLIGSVGFLGSFTTFSAFGFETFNLLRLGLIGPATLNILGNMVLGLLAVWLGRVLALHCC
jgi:fluoride exporter